MPLRPQLPAGLNLSRRVTTPVKLPKMTFPMGDGYAEQDAETPAPAAPAMGGPGSEASRARLALFQQPAQEYEQPAPAQAAMSAYERAAPAQAALPAYERAAPAQAALPAYERAAPAQVALPAYERAAPVQAALPAYERAAQAVPTVPAAHAQQLIVFGRAGCEASIAAIQDLIDREISFTYYDVGRDPRAMAHLQAICGNAPMVPVIIQIGFAGV
jgi:hypothetical protein